MSPPADGKDGEHDQSWRHRFLKGTTGPQRLVLAVGALAAAVLAIGGVVTAIVRFVDGDDSRRIGPATDEEQRIENQSAAADELVGFLIDHDEGAVQLNHQVIAPRGPNDVSLQYACDEPAGCSVVRLQLPDSTPNEIPNGLWFQGCYLVVMKGAGYQADPLDLELRWRGETCAAQ